MAGRRAMYECIRYILAHTREHYNFESPQITLRRQGINRLYTGAADIDTGSEKTFHACNEFVTM